MGNLFGSTTNTQQESKREVFPPQRSSYNDIQRVTQQIRTLSVGDQHVQRNVVNHNRQTVNTNRNSFQSWSGAVAPVSPSSLVVTRRPNPLKQPKLVSAGDIDYLMDLIQNYSATLNWDERDYNQSQVYFVELNCYNWEYQQIQSSFTNTNKKCFKITQIERIQNPYLLAAFLLKKEAMSRRTTTINVQQLFHGTKAASVKSICTDNFDWRRYGQNVGNKFGQGISFTSISNYATHYADDSCDNRVMLLVHVLVGNETIGTANMNVPPDGYDTSIKPGGQVTVKYEDNEFYPAYKITYKCTNPDELINRQQNKKNNRRVRAPRQVVRQEYYDDYFDY